MDKVSKMEYWKEQKLYEYKTDYKNKQITLIECIYKNGEEEPVENKYIFELDKIEELEKEIRQTKPFTLEYRLDNDHYTEVFEILLAMKDIFYKNVKQSYV